MNEFFERYDAFESGLIERFNQHPFFLRFAALADEQVIVALLQLGYISRNFVPWYQEAGTCLEGEQAKEIVWSILRDEIPSDKPIHQEDRLVDLMAIGVPKERVINEPASVLTSGMTAELYRLIRYPQPDYDLTTLVTLRVFGEILVSETYRYVVERFGRKKCKRFYYPHYVHDKKGNRHSNVFGDLFRQLIVDERTLIVAKGAATIAFMTRYRFYDQFIEQKGESPAPS